MLVEMPLCAAVGKLPPNPAVPIAKLTELRFALVEPPLTNPMEWPPGPAPP